MFSQNKRSAYSRPGGSFRRSPRRPRIEWSHPPSSPQRRGEGVQYGSLNLTPTSHQSSPQPTTQSTLPTRLRIAVLGGNEEVGKNMTLIEYGEDILLIDMGIQFAEEGMLGVDGCVPDLSYLRGKEHRVRGVIITHMHTDHIGGIPYLMPLLPNVPIFSAPLSLALIAKKLEYTPELKIDLRSIDEQSVLHLGQFTVRFIGVCHSVPAALGIVIETPVGRVVHTGDFKVDLDPQSAEGKKMHQALIDLGQQNILALMSDSTNAYAPGHQIMEREIEHDLDKIFMEHPHGRLLFGMISTNVERLNQLITCAERHGRHVFIGGLSLKTTFELAEQLGYINAKAGTMVDAGELKRLPKQKIMAIFPGAQGEPNGAFSRLADGKHRDIDVESGDTVIFSSSVIPGNERTVQFVTDKFFHRGARVINFKMLDIHSGGHAKQEDLKEVVKLVKPKYLIPIEGHHAFLHYHADAAQSIGFPAEHILIARNGQIMEFDERRNGYLTQHFLPQKRVFVRGGKVDQVNEDTLRERRQIGEEGVLIITRTKESNHVEHVHLRSHGITKPEKKHIFHQTIGNFLKQILPRESRTVDMDERTYQKVQQRLERFLEERYGAKPLICLQ